jgi:dihydrolipoamide dehydrogenase
VRRTPLAIAFTAPNIATVGARFVDLEPDSFVAGEVDFSEQGRARVMGEGRGVLRIYAARPTGRILGAEMFGPRVEHMAHLVAWAISEGMTVQRALQMPFYHPVVEEGLRTAIRDAAIALKLASSPCAAGLDCSPGS